MRTQLSFIPEDNLPRGGQIAFGMQWRSPHADGLRIAQVGFSEQAMVALDEEEASRLLESVLREFMQVRNASAFDDLAEAQGFAKGYQKDDYIVWQRWFATTHIERLRALCGV